MFGKINKGTAKRGKPRGKNKTATKVTKNILLSDFPEPEFIDQGILATDGYTYYKKAIIEGHEFNLYDSAQVLTANDENIKDNLFFCLIVQMRKSPTGEKEAKVNWYWRKEEIPEELQCYVLRRELLLSETIDFIPLDSIRSKITVHTNSSELGNKANCKLTANTSSYFCNRGYFTAQAELVAVSTIHRIIKLFNEEISHVESGTKHDIARARLQLNYVKFIHGRENEMKLIKDAVERFLMRAGAGGCLYVSGVPGTGKTLCVKEVMKQISKKILSGEIPDFEFYEINCLRFKECASLFKEMWLQITGEHLSVKTSRTRLNHLFTKHPPSKYIILLIDEIDVLLNMKQTEIYCLLEWACLPKSHLIVICIANLMDIEHRLAPKIQSRFGKETIHFLAYKANELKSIISARVEDLEIFQPAAIEYCSKNIANIGGDARKALEACRRAIDFVADDENGVVKLQTMVKAVKDLNEIRGVSILEKISINQKIFLIAFLTELKLKDITAALMRDVVKRFYAIQKNVKDAPQVNPTMILIFVNQLIDMKIINTQNKLSLTANSTIVLVCSDHDLIISLNKCKELKKLVGPLMPKN